jgi:hypothetical protein
MAELDRNLKHLGLKEEELAKRETEIRTLHSKQLELAEDEKRKLRERIYDAEQREKLANDYFIRICRIYRSHNDQVLIEEQELKKISDNVIDLVKYDQSELDKLVDEFNQKRQEHVSTTTTLETKTYKTESPTKHTSHETTVTEKVEPLKAEVGPLREKVESLTVPSLTSNPKFEHEQPFEHEKKISETHHKKSPHHKKPHHEEHPKHPKEKTHFEEETHHKKPHEEHLEEKHIEDPKHTVVEKQPAYETTTHGTEKTHIEHPKHTEDPHHKKPHHEEKPHIFEKAPKHTVVEKQPAYETTRDINPSKEPEVKHSQ